MSPDRAPEAPSPSAPRRSRGGADGAASAASAVSAGADAVSVEQAPMMTAIPVATSTAAPRRNPLERALRPDLILIRAPHSRSRFRTPYDDRVDLRSRGITAAIDPCASMQRPTTSRQPDRRIRGENVVASACGNLTREVRDIPSTRKIHHVVLPRGSVLRCPVAGGPGQFLRPGDLIDGRREAECIAPPSRRHGLHLPLAFPLAVDTCAHERPQRIPDDPMCFGNTDAHSEMRHDTRGARRRPILHCSFGGVHGRCRSGSGAGDGRRRHLAIGPSRLDPTQ